MGYTHYFGILKSPTPEQWEPIRKAVRKIFDNKALGSLIRFESNSTEPPLADEDVIRFNGIEDEGHETFYLPREDEGFQFCKTARKPYDDIVTACLIIVNHFAPSCYDIGSDGDPENWEVGQQIAEAAVGEFIPIPIS